jgi:HEAT repeat protein
VATLIPLMQSLSSQTRQLIEALHAPPDLLHRLLRPTPGNADLLAHIADAGEPAAIPYLLPLTMARDAVAEQAATVVRRLLEHTPSLDLLHLDGLSRDTPWYLSDFRDQWRRLRAADLSRLGRLTDGWAVVAMAASHPSGYVREGAVRQLPDIAGSKALPFLILRLNDWVAPVRQAAEVEVERLLAQPDFTVIAESLPLVLRLPAWSRADHARFLDRVRMILRQPVCLPALLCGIESPDPLTRRECVGLALSAVTDPGPVIERALASRDPYVRLGAVRGLSALDDEPLRQHLKRAVSDRFGPVRLEALKLAVSRLSDEVALSVRQALFDLSPFIREYARYSLAQQEAQFDAAEHYRQTGLAEAGSRLRGAILGLSEVGRAPDAALLEPLCSHAHPKIRAAAVRAVGRLDAEGRMETLLAALADPSRRVSNTAASALSRKSGLVEIDTFRDFALSDIWPAHTRLNALRLLSSLSKWVGLPILVHAAAASDPHVAMAAHSYLRGWYSRDFRKPTLQQLQAVQQALQETAHTLDPSVRANITAAVRLWLSSP